MHHRQWSAGQVSREVIVGRKTNKQRRAAQGTSAREKAAAARATQRQAEQRARAQKIIGVVVVLALIVVAAVVYGVTRPSKANDASGNRAPAPAALVSAVTSVTPAELASVGVSTKIAVQKTKGDPALTANGKPELLFIGGEFCPFCAAERWAMLQALSRFGTFSNLSVIHSANDDGDIATFSFYKSTYVSKYLTFTPVEAEDRASKALETPTTEQAKIWNKYGGSFPFLDFGGKYYQTGAAYSDTDLSGLSQTQIAAQLKDPTSKIAKDILGEANNITAEICTLTNNQPTKVCLQPTITNLQSLLDA
jgi:Domain of unknown function (DUF929)